MTSPDPTWDRAVSYMIDSEVSRYEDVSPEAGDAASFMAMILRDAICVTVVDRERVLNAIANTIAGEG